MPLAVAAPLSVRRWLARHAIGTKGVAAAGRHRGDEVVGGVRRRRPKDLDGCVRLLRLVAFEGHYPDDWSGHPRAWLEGDELLDAWVAVDGSDILGHVAILRTGLDTPSAVRWRELTGQDAAELAGVSRLFVRPRLRRRGIGTELVDAAVAASRARGLTPVLEVLDPSTEARAFLEAREWRLRADDRVSRGTDEHRIHRYVHAPAPRAD